MKGYEFQSEYLTVPEGRLHCRVAGPADGLPVLFIHGLSNFSRDWEVLDGLPEGLRWIAPDLPGFGDSDETADHTYPQTLMVESMVRVLQTFAAGPALVVGHSRGARTVLGLPERGPDVVKALVMIDGGPGVPPDARMEVAQKIAGIPHEFPSVEEAYIALKNQFPAYTQSQFIERLGYYLRKTESGTFAIKRDLCYRHEFQAVLEGKAKEGPAPGGPDWWGMFQAAPVPITLIRASKSLMISENILHKMQTLRPDLDVITMDCGHNVPGDKPEELAQVISGIIARIV